MSQISTSATINSCTINYRAGDLYGSTRGSLVFTKLSRDWPNMTLSDAFSAIGSSAQITSIVISSSDYYHTSLPTWVANLQSAVQTSPHTIGLGIYNGSENSLAGMSYVYSSITINYTVLTPPKVTGLHMVSSTPGSMIIQWNAVSGNVTGYKVYKNGTLYGTTTTPTMTICGLSPTSTYTFYIVAYNSEGDGDKSDNTVLGPTGASSISGPLLLCNVENYSLSNVPIGATISWQAPSNMSLESPQNTNPASFQKSSIGGGTITATISSTCENYIVSSSLIHTGPYSSSDYQISGPSSASCKSYVYYSIPSLPGATSINWVYPSTWTYVSGQGTTNLALRTGSSGSSGMVLVGVNNTCGQSGSYSTKYTSVYGTCSMSLIIFPNPASEEVSITIPDKQVSDNESSSEANTAISQTNDDESGLKKYKVIISDNNGIIYSSTTKNSKSFTIPIQKLKNGNYIISVSESSNVYTSILIVKH